MSEKFEQSRSRLADPEFRKKLKNAFADKLEELATDPKYYKLKLPTDLGAKVRKGEKVSDSDYDGLVHSAVLEVISEVRLSLDESDGFKKLLIEGARGDIRRKDLKFKK